MNIFEQASRLKLRISSSLGNLSVEDLWSLSLTNLDKLAVSLNQELEETPKTSFLSNQSNENSLLRLKFDVVYHILKTKMEEKEAANLNREKLRQKEILVELLHDKETEALRNLSPEEIKAKISELG